VVIYKMSKALVFDAGPIISLTMNNLLWVLRKLRREFRGSFLITESVKNELVDRPIMTKRFKFEAIQVLKEIYTGTLNVVRSETIRNNANRILELANHTFKANNAYIQIVQRGEIESIAALKHLNGNAVVIDERTTRMLVEEPENLRNLMQSRLHRRVEVNRENLKKLREELYGVRVIRSAELITIAYEKGILDTYVLPSEMKLYRNLDKQVLESTLWGLKLNGCSISQREIEQILKLES